MGIYNFTTPSSHYLGKLPAKPEAVRFRLGDYLDLPEIKPPPAFGFINNVIEWGQLGNNRAGCCVVSGAAHEHMLWTRAVDKAKMSEFNDANVLDEYKRASGWNGVQDDASDTGLYMADYASHRRRVGIPDADGNMRKIAAYASIKGIDNIIKATYVFGAVGIGFKFPKSAAVQFHAEQPWSIVPNSPIVGGHYVVMCGRNSNGHLIVITWGRLHAVTSDFFEKYCDEALAYISEDFLDESRQTPRHFAESRLRRDLASLTG